MAVFLVLHYILHCMCFILIDANFAHNKNLSSCSNNVVSLEKTYSSGK